MTINKISQRRLTEEEIIRLFNLETFKNRADLEKRYLNYYQTCLKYYRHLLDRFIPNKQHKFTKEEIEKVIKDNNIQKRIDLEKISCRMYQVALKNFPEILPEKLTKIWTPEKRFWKMVNKSGHNGCWNWIGSKTRKGYGKFGINGKFIRAHRYSYELHIGPIPKDMFVCHSCDNPSCVNPKHLWIGTNRDNIIDCWKKGRHPTALKRCIQMGKKQGPKNIGENNQAAKLTQEQVNEIRKLRQNGATLLELVEMFKVHKGTIRSICTGRSWKHSMLGSNSKCKI